MQPNVYSTQNNGILGLFQLNPRESDLCKKVQGNSNIRYYPGLYLLECSVKLPYKGKKIMYLGVVIDEPMNVWQLKDAILNTDDLKVFHYGISTYDKHPRKDILKFFITSANKISDLEKKVENPLETDRKTNLTNQQIERLKEKNWAGRSKDFEEIMHEKQPKWRF
jgi:hypothetical protein